MLNVGTARTSGLGRYSALVDRRTADILPILVRPLLAVLILMLSLTTSGITSAVAATIGDGDCCAESGEEARELGQDEQTPDSDRDPCPPLCHACACSPMFAVPSLVAPHPVTRELHTIDPIDGYSQLPASPPGTDVFHPPRRFA